MGIVWQENVYSRYRKFHCPQSSGEDSEAMPVPQTSPEVFIAIVLGTSLLIFLGLGAKKAFFEPYTGPDES